MPGDGLHYREYRCPTFFSYTKIIFLFSRMGRVGLWCINRADFSTLGRLEVAHALDAFIGVNDIDGFSLANGLYRALRLAGSATDALIVDHICHSIYLLNSSLENSNRRENFTLDRLHSADALLPESFGNVFRDQAVDVTSQAGNFFH
jgi:hypothetical protein